MNGLIHSSLYFGMLVSVGAYMLGVWLKKKTGWAILNPLLVAIIVVIAFLSVFHIEYKEYNRGAVYLSYFLTPATVCLAIPLYKQLELLRQHLIAVVSAIVAGVAGSVGIPILACKFFRLINSFSRRKNKMIGLALCLGRPAAEAGRQDEME